MNRGVSRRGSDGKDGSDEVEGRVRGEGVEEIESKNEVSHFLTSVVTKG
jgi:hypothetical protein